MYARDDDTRTHRHTMHQTMSAAVSENKSNERSGGVGGGGGQREGGRDGGRREYSLVFSCFPYADMLSVKYNTHTRDTAPPLRCLYTHNMSIQPKF